MVPLYYCSLSPHTAGSEGHHNDPHPSETETKGDHGIAVHRLQSLQGLEQPTIGMQCVHIYMH